MTLKKLLTGFTLASALFCTTAQAQGPPRVEVRIQNNFVLEALHVWVDGNPAGNVNPNSTRTAMLPNGSDIVVKPDVSEGVGFTAGPGRWVIEPDGFFTFKTKITQVE